jgi:hypothetical protein
MMSDNPNATPQAAPIPPDDPQRSLVLARPDEDQNLPHIGLVGDTYTILLEGEDTAGRYCLIDMQMFSVLEGEIEVTFRGEKSTVRAGEIVNIPANAPHSFANASERSARLLCVCSPAGQDEFFLAVGVPVDGRTAAPPELDEAAQAAFVARSQELAPRYRTELLGP